MIKVVKMILLLLCMLTIFFFSHDSGAASTKKSDQVVLGMSHFLFPSHLSEKQKQKVMDSFIVPVRKGAHFIIYFLLGILILSNLREYFSWHDSLVFMAIFLAFLYACSDEVHQLLIAGRSGQFTDVLLDTVGAGFGCFFYHFVYRRREAKKIHE